MYLQSFRSSLLRLLGVESRIGEVMAGGRPVRLEALPIGIAPEEYTELLQDDRTAAQYNDLKARYRGLKVILAVDRLDYTKGMPERLRAYRRLLESDAGLRQKVVLIQIAVPTREGIDTYEDLRSEVNRLIGEINGKAGSSDWTPIVYVNRAIERQELVALYRLADVAWVSPLRDGMNLVAKEYAACKPEGDGVLVLSEFAGAAAEMGEALLVNPYDEESTALAVARALELDEDERRKRMLALHRRVLRNNVFAWSETFLSHLGEAVLARAARVGDSSPRPLPVSEAVDAYRAAGRRLLLLDYDGTLVGFTNVPERAKPPESLLRDLRALAAEPANLVALVSGRASHDLARWFGDVRGLWLFAEHGVEVRDPGQNAWAPNRPIQTEDWKGKVLPILEHFVDRTPGSSVEEKNYSLVWHYRMAEPEFGAWLANELVAMLEGMLAETELRAVRGDKIVEVKPNWANKGQVVDYLSSIEPSADFRLAVGDDRTDEDLFTRADSSWWTVKVGDAPSAARFFVPSVDAVRALLARFIAEPGRSGRPVTSHAS
jgi:trehalose 6-phosphate synthase/phosphatase